MDQLPIGNQQPLVARAEGSKMSQKDAVYKIIMDTVEATKVPVSVLKDTSNRSVEKKQANMRIKSAILAALKTGEISLKTEKTEAQLKAYSASLLSNWLKRDKRFA